MLTALLLGRAGATVVAADPSPERRALAASLGISAVAPEELPSRLPAEGVPLLLELSGSPTALAGALDLLAHEGTALVGSWYGRQPVELPLGGAFHRRRLTIRSSQVSTVPAALGARWDVGRRRQVAVELLGELPLSREIITALLNHDGAKGRLLRAAIAYERGNFAELGDLPPTRTPLSDLYASAVEWATEASGGLPA
jgi:D-arabinose 1-dehydrogenase-like Zn-dependent alcohol dehydrogenase